MASGNKRPQFCTNCGAKLGETVKFCPDCGTAVMAAEMEKKKPAKKEQTEKAPALISRVGGPVAAFRVLMSDKKLRRVMIAALVLVVVIVIAIVLLASGGRDHSAPSVDRDDGYTAQIDNTQQDNGEANSPSVSGSAEKEAVEQDKEQSADDAVQMDAPIDPASTLLPDIRNFLYVYKEDESAGWLGGRRISYNGCLPLTAFETVREELLNLLQEEKYQLTLRESRLDPHQGIPAPQYYFDYIGSGDIADVTDKYEEMRYDVLLQMYLHEEDGYFSFVLHYADGFVLADPGSRTTRDVRDMRDGGTGEVITEPPSGSSNYGYFYGENGSGVSSGDDNDFFDKCSACHGSGRCTHCGGDDEVKKFQAGLGWVEQNCTFCTGGRCRYCGGDGKA